MSKIIKEIESLKKKAEGYWGERMVSELQFASNLSDVKGGRYEEEISKAVDYLLRVLKENGALTKDAVINSEKMMGGLHDEAKKIRMICAAHAHIDMNWMWGYPETVAVVLETFRTMLDLMNEYPLYKFSQSQASVYRIVEEHDPDMLSEIKKRVGEGRWEVTASTWVETDKNMPNGESLARHILYTKRYLSELLDIDPETLNIDFEPDTFGHNRNVPEILANGGVKYYYHCRGYDGHNLYRWQAPSGRSVIVYGEPLWYGCTINADIARHVPGFCSAYGISTALKVYGVGDHGGGPTRRDIEKLIEMNTWPVFPTIQFGTFGEFFRVVDCIANRLPVVKKELNFIFTGCYTTQTRIKMANRIGEAKLNEAEAFGAISKIFVGGSYRGKIFADSWKNVLFCHFHDILTGSGVIDTREYAMGLFQKTIASTNTENSLAFKKIAASINTSGLVPCEETANLAQSEGAGVGFGVSSFRIPSAERGRGISRIFHVFNPAAYERRENVEITVWDWEGDKNRIIVKDTGGNTVRHQLIGNKKTVHRDSNYWGHKYITVLIDAKLPAYGYNTYVLTEKEPGEIKFEGPDVPRVERDIDYVLENSHIKVVFHPEKASIISMIDCKTGKEMISRERPAGVFRLIEEDDSRGMTAWRVGRYMRIRELNSTENVKINEVHNETGSLRQWMEYELSFRSSRLRVKVSLDAGNTGLEYSVCCDWQEHPVKGESIPQLNFYMPVGYTCEGYEYDIPFGTIVREPADMDVPGNSWMLGVPDENKGKAIVIATDTKYGFRGIDNSLAVNLIRSSYDPDPYPEFGFHNFKLSVSVIDSDKHITPIRKAYDFNHAMNFLPGTAHEGKLPTSMGFIFIESGNIVLSSVKCPEDNIRNALVVRVYETEGRKADAILGFAGYVRKASYIDINENLLDCELKIECRGKKVIFDVEANSIATLLIEF